MDPTQIGIFDLAARRLTWADKRQELLAQNIANANTPGFQARDLQPFAVSLTQASGAGLVRTQPNHLSGVGGDATHEITVRPPARALDGNAVSLDEQLVKVADTETTQSLVTTIYKKYLSLFSMALGGGTSS
jgi:flagellar basal-body rod protein FlgB